MDADFNVFGRLVLFAFIVATGTNVLFALATDIGLAIFLGCCLATNGNFADLETGVNGACIGFEGFGVG